MKILFMSCHALIDPSSGAAISSLQLLQLLAARGHDCRALSTGVLDFREETRIESVLGGLAIPYDAAEIPMTNGGRIVVLDMVHRRVRITLLPTKSSSTLASPDPDESGQLLLLASEALDRFRPDVVLTYGGHPVSMTINAEAVRRRVPVVFFLRNLSYRHVIPFVETSGILVASEFVRRYYSKALGLDCTVIPSPLDWDACLAVEPSPEYLTFVNPSPEKGSSVFARIAAELDRRRPDIPLLVVESRWRAATLADAGLDLSGLRNLHAMGVTHHPRDFYGVSRAILMPSLWEEPFGRVAAEGLINGIPVLASDRGGLPDTLGGAGFVLPLPRACTPTSSVVPTAEEVRPWLEVIERLWDDRQFESHHRGLALASGRRFGAEALLDQYEAFFHKVSQRGVQSP